MAPILPVELVEHCFSFVDRADKSTLAAVYRSCTLGKRLTLTRLYETVGIANADLKRTDRSRRLHLLCRTLLECQDLAKFANRMEHFLDTTIDIGRNVSETSGVILDRSACVDLLKGQRNLPSPVVDPVLDNLRRDQATDEAHIMLLMLLCPNLGTLVFTGELCVMRRMLLTRDILIYVRACMAGDVETNTGESLAPAESREARLRRVELSHEAGLYTIEEVILSNTPTYTGGCSTLTYEDMYTLLKMPKLRKLSVAGLDKSSSEEFDYDNPAYVSYNDSFVVELNLTSCFAKSEDVAKLLYGCYRLRSLNIQWASKEDAHRRFDWPELGWCFHASLRRLYIDHDRNCELGADEVGLLEMGVLDDDYMMKARLPPLHNLQKLRQLTHLTVTKNALLGTVGSRGGFTFPDDDVEFDDWGNGPPLPSLGDVLPESLLELTIICESKGIRNEAQELLGDPRAASLTNLTVIDSQKQHWFTKNDGEGGVDPYRESRRNLHFSRLVQTHVRDVMRSLEVNKDQYGTFQQHVNDTWIALEKGLVDYNAEHAFGPPTNAEVEALKTQFNAALTSRLRTSTSSR